MNWPVTEKMTVSVGKRGRFLGAGGSNLKKILTDTGVQISQNPDDASEYTLFAPNSEAMSEAKEMIKSSLNESRIPEFEFGATYEVMITEIIDRGVFVQLHPDLKPAFIPNNQLDARKVKIYLNKQLSLKNYVKLIIFSDFQCFSSWIQRRPKNYGEVLWS